MPLSGVEDFKNVTAYPSGRDVATGKETSSRYAKTLAAVCGAALFTVGIGWDLVAYTDAANYPAEEKAALTAEYDTALLATIDSLHNTGLSMENSVEKGVLMQTNRAKYKMSVKDAEAIIVMKHANQRLAQSRKIDHINKRSETSLGFSATRAAMGFSGLTVDEETVYDTVYAYKPEFRNQLAEDIHLYRTAVQQKATEAEIAADTTTHAAVRDTVPAAKIEIGNKPNKDFRAYQSNIQKQLNVKGLSAAAIAAKKGNSR
ncbi:MAG: hypothetical protein IKR09_05250 [Alphaproteobacteria bacterium]|nr:hypothetical protein [Alphaproteobacteria bacterium]